jgi:hypothetical protein
MRLGSTAPADAAKRARRPKKTKVDAVRSKSLNLAVPSPPTCRKVSPPSVERARPGPTRATVFASGATMALGRPLARPAVDQVAPALVVLRTLPVASRAKPVLASGNETSVMAADVVTFGALQSSPPLVVRSSAPLSPTA